MLCNVDIRLVLVCRKAIGAYGECSCVIQGTWHFKVVLVLVRQASIFNVVLMLVRHKQARHV